MTSCDTNILFAACNRDAPQHGPARAFLAAHAGDSRFVLCEQVLMELYCLLRNPAVFRCPLTAIDAGNMIQSFRRNPVWRIVDVPLERAVMDRVWRAASSVGFAYRKIFDIRLAQTLLHHGVASFATRNTKDFDGCGFSRVFDPCAVEA
jgi:toxin-antitoxin system PIN domain toxin